MKKCLILSLCVIAISLIVSCTPNVGGVGSISDLEVNTYSVNDKVDRLNSVAVMMVGENLSVVATPTAGIGSAEAILECDEYIFASVNPLLVGKSFNLKTETSLFTFISTLAGATLESVAPEMTSEIAAGEAQVIYENNIAVVKADITLIGGTTLKFVLSAEREVEVNSNTIARGSEEKPLRTTFYHEEDGLTTLYFTPAGIDYFAELENVTYYIYIMVSTDLVDGRQKDIATIGNDNTFVFGLVDNIRNSNSFEIMTNDLQGATGDFRLVKSGEETYAADIAISVGGTLHKVSFIGGCTSAIVEPEKKSNYLLCDGTEYTISAATITKGTEYWSVEFSTSSGKNITLTAPESFFDGAAHGFSQSADFTVTYDGVTYCKESGDSGTLTATYTSNSGDITVDFTNYDNLEFNYTGVVEVK